MGRLFAFAVVFVAFVVMVSAAAPPPPSMKSEIPHLAFTNGLWFDGTGFTRTTFYTVDGILTDQRPEQLDDIIDLGGRYVVPPFGEAHNHNIDSYSGEANVRRYLTEGIYYVKNPNAVPRLNYPGEQLNHPGSVDLSLAVGSLTASGGHPLGLFRRNLSREVFRPSDGEGAFFFVIDDASQLDLKWNAIRAANPEFIKTYLLYSEEYSARREEETYFAWRGLDPELLPRIVSRAHGDGLRVSTHIESAVDFRHAVAAGVDEINHMPGFRNDRDRDLATYDVARYRIAEEDAKAAGRQGITVVTTLSGSFDRIRKYREETGDDERADSMTSLHLGNLRLLHEHDVPIALGSDQYRGTSSAEFSALHRLKAFDTATLLKMWSENTAATIFPDRRIGRLRAGFEASFLVLPGNPLDSAAHLQSIEIRVKQGRVIEIPAAPEED